MSVHVIDEINHYLDTLKNTLDHIDRNEIRTFIELLLAAYRQEANIFIFGNGGSAVAASHFACDINKGVSYGMDKRFRVIPLTDNIATLTAYSNDVGYEEVFVEQLKNLIGKDDIVIGISGSGNSQNVIKAVEYAKQRGNTTLGLTGYNGGKLKQIADYSINVNVNDMQISEDVHVILSHLSMRLLTILLHAR